MQPWAKSNVFGEPNWARPKATGWTSSQPLIDVYEARPFPMDLRQDYGERRYLVNGSVEGILITVVWTPRGSRRRIISA